MIIRSRRLRCLLALAVGVMPVTGCKQLQAIFATRPSEQHASVQPVEVEAENQNLVSRPAGVVLYHTPQGTELLPYKWFLALEQPRIKILERFRGFPTAATWRDLASCPTPSAPRIPSDYLLALRWTRTSTLKQVKLWKS